MLNDAVAFGNMIRARRRAARLSQRDLAAVVDTGERFIVDLEAGKPTCQLGKALSVASALGIILVDARQRQCPHSREEASPSQLQTPTRADDDLPDPADLWDLKP